MQRRTPAARGSPATDTHTTYDELSVVTGTIGSMSDDEQAPDHEDDGSPSRGIRRTPAFEMFAAHQQTELDARFAKIQAVAEEASKAYDEKFAHLLKRDPTVETVQRMMDEHQKRMAPIVAMIDNGVLADMQRFAAAVEPALAQAKSAADAAFSPQMRLMLDQINRRHRNLFAQVDLAFPVNPVISGAVVKGNQAVEHDTALPGTVATITTIPAQPRPRPRLTGQQQLALLVTLAGLHGYVMDLRRADLADAGTLALIVALLLVVLALQQGDAE
jgi:hypothetical protein